MVDEELAEFVEDVRAIHRADIGHVRQRLGAGHVGVAAGHAEGDVAALGEGRQAALEAGEGIPASGDLQHQGAELSVAGQAAADHGAAALDAGAAEQGGQLHRIGAEGADQKELFAGLAGGHSTFLEYAGGTGRT